MGKEGFTVTIHHRSGAPVSRLSFGEGDELAGGASYGQPPAYRGPPVDCDYCNSSCLLNERSMCPNCGAPLRVSQT